MKQNILIIEDNKKLNDGMCLALKNKDYNDGRQIMREQDFSLILLDVNLPDGNGIDFVKEIRRQSSVPVILITVNNMEVDIVTGLEAGADDYITKPFSLMVLRARVGARLRNIGERTDSRVKIDDFDFDFDKMKFFKDGEPLELSKTEQKLLKILCVNKGVTMKRSYLIDSIWQGDTEFVDDHALTVVIKRLRDKLEDDSQHPVYIKTVYGIGYTWAVKS